MVGIFHSQDLMITGEESDHRTECRSANIIINTDAPDTVWFIPFESDGYTILDTYTVNMEFIPTNPFADVYSYSFAVYRQHSKLSDVATTNGVGVLVANSTYASGALTGIVSLRDTASLDNPILLPQGSYFVAFTVYAVAPLSGPLQVRSNDGINAGTVASWVNQSHMVGTLATPGTLPTNITTSDAALSALAGTFISGIESLWVGVFYNGDAYP